MTVVLCALFCLSGISALLFETLWFREAGLAFGNSVWASSVVLSSFMAGLALGNGLAARFAGRLEDPLRAYAALELTIAIIGVVLVYHLEALTPLLVRVLEPVLDVPWLQNLIRLGFGFVMLLLPATAMGATLPVIVLALRARDPSFGGALGRLYGWNTLGAVAGAMLGELWLLERFGVHGAAFAAAGCNVIAAGGALLISRRLPRPERPPQDPRSWRPDARSLRLLAAAFGAGGILLALEVVWFRFLHLFVIGTAAFALMLAVVLVGIGIGGLAAGAWLRRRPDAWRAAPVLALAAGMVSVALYAAFTHNSAFAEGLDYTSPLLAAWLTAVLALPVALVSGALFPLLAAGLTQSVSSEASAVGWLALANTLGSAIGSLLAGFVLLPVLGMEYSLFGLAAAYGGVALLARVPAAEGAPSRWNLVATAVFVVALALFPFGDMTAYMLAPVDRWHGGHEHEVLAVREGRTETAALVERRHAGERLNTFLMTDGFSMSASATLARRYMKLYVYWAVALRPEPKSALLISYGLGSTASALVGTRSLETIDVVDISREILSLADVVYPVAAENPLRDPRVRVHVEDGRYFLRRMPQRYDLITAEPPPPKNAGVVNLYTREYFSLIRDRLTQGGVTTYWLPVHNLLESDAQAIVRAFCDVFDDCALWVGQSFDWMLTASRGGLARPTEVAFSAQWRDPAVSTELRALGFERAEQLGATFLGDAAWLREWTAEVAPLTDAWPKRLSNRPQQDVLGTFLGRMDAAAAQQRFQSSDYVRAIWPTALRERSLRFFELQRLLNSISRGESVSWPQTLAEMHRLLTDPVLPELALWRLGITSDEVHAAQSAVRARRPLAPHAYTLARRKLVDGNFAAAAKDFAGLRGSSGDRTGPKLLEAYALCRAGELDAATAVLAAGGRFSGDAAFLESVAWFEQTFGLRVPQAP